MFKQLTTIAVKVGKHFAKHGHTYLTVAGAAGSVATVAMTVKATRKMDELSAKYNDTKELIEENAAKFPQGTVEKDLGELKTSYIVDSIKTVAPVVLVGAASLLCFGLAWGITSKRLKALGAAYSVLKLEYDKYRDRTREAVGEEKELEIYHQAQEDVRIELEQVGKVDLFELHGRWFSESSEFCKDDPAYNNTILAQAEQAWDTFACRKGEMTMNEFFDNVYMTKKNKCAALGWNLSNPFVLYKKIVVQVDDHTGEHYQDIYLQWSKPVPLYD